MLGSWQTTAAPAEQPVTDLAGVARLVTAVGGEFVAAAVGVGACILAYYVFRLVVLTGLDRVSRATDNDLDDRLVQFVRKFSVWAFLFVAVAWVLKVYDVDISPLLAGAGIAGIAIGFAAREVLADILAGIFLIADRPMRNGDRVKIERIGSEWGGWGDVLDIGLRRTRIRNSDGVIVNYPNSVLSASVITNFSDESGPIRVRVRFQVAYDSDVEKALGVACKAIQGSDRVLDGTAEVVVRSVWDVTRGHATAGILLEGRYRIEDVRNRTKIRSAVLRNLIASLRETGIELAVPVVDLRK
jgi:small-conductance mechanosensitive channel